jgi:Mn2+/Fe2+ NRAMP family transporter
LFLISAARTFFVRAAEFPSKDQSTMANHGSNSADPGVPQVAQPPHGLGILLLVGPSLVWASEYIGSGEVVLAPRTGGILGISVLWVVIMAIFLKCWIGMSGARYTACTGEGMIDMIDRVPGPRHWGVWLVLVVQFVAAAFSIGAIANACASFMSELIRLAIQSPGFGYYTNSAGTSSDILKSCCGVFVVIFGVTVSWTGKFGVLKMVMSGLVLAKILAAVYIAARLFPGITEVARGLMFRVPEVPQWAAEKILATGKTPSSWGELIPLIGWSAGGFASQVWYTYWVIGANYGATAGRGYGRPADVGWLRTMPADTARRIKGWCKVVYADATNAVIIGVVVTSAFLIMGAVVLGDQPPYGLKLVPQKQEMARTLSNLFGSMWGDTGKMIYLLAGIAALTGTLTGQLAGWPRLLADSSRICIPPVQRFPWKSQFRFFLVVFFITSLMTILALGNKPDAIIQFAAVLDGVLLTSLQAIWVMVGLYWVLPRLLSKEAYAVLRPSWIFAPLLGITAIVFAILTVYQVPDVLTNLLKALRQ